MPFCDKRKFGRFEGLVDCFWNSHMCEFDCSVCMYKSEWTWKSVLPDAAFLRLIIDLQTYKTLLTQPTKRRSIF